MFDWRTWANFSKPEARIAWDEYINDRVAKAQTQRFNDPIAFDVGTILSGYWLSPYSSLGLTAIANAMRAYQRVNNLTDKQMKDAIYRSAELPTLDFPNPDQFLDWQGVYNDIYTPVGDDEINAYYQSVISGPGTDRQKAEMILNEARNYNINAQKLAVATGLSFSNVARLYALASNPAAVSADLQFDVDNMLSGLRLVGITGRSAADVAAMIRTMQMDYDYGRETFNFPALTDAQVADAMVRSPYFAGKTFEQALALLNIVESESPLAPPVRPLDLVNARTGTTTPASNVVSISQDKTVTVSDQEIKQFVDDTLSRPGTDKQKAQIIFDAKQTYQLTSQRIANATGYSVAEVNNFLKLAEKSTVPSVKQSDMSSVTTTPVTASNVLPLALAAIAFYFLG